MIFFIIGFTLPIILWGISVGLKVTLKSYMLMMDGEEGQLSHNLYNKISSRNSGLVGSIKKGVSNVQKMGKTGAKAVKTAYKVGKTTVKLSIKAVKATIAFIKFLIAVIKALIALISASTVALVILIILLLVVLIAAVVTVIIGNENAQSGNISLTKTKVSDIQNSNKDGSSSSDSDAESAYSEDVATRILQVACEYAKNQKLKYGYGANGSSGSIDCSHFVCGIVLEATGYTWKGKKSTKNFKVTDGVGINNADYKATGGLYSDCPKGACIEKGATVRSYLSKDTIKKKAKPGDILVNDHHAAIYYGEVDGKLYWVEASSTNGVYCSKTIEDAKKGKKGYSVGISEIRDVSIIIRPACKISKLNK